MKKRVRYHHIFRLVCFLFLLSLSLSVMTLVTSCGRRGDPVLVVPRDESTVQNEPERVEDVGEVPVRKEEETGETGTSATAPSPPEGFVGVFSQPVIILSWDEVTEQNIRFYKVYRASKEGYAFIGTTISTAFTDRRVEPNTAYHYRVSAVRDTEGPLSKEIMVTTGAPW